MTITKGMKQAYDVQDFAYNCLMALQANLKQDTHDGQVLAAPDKETCVALGTLGKVWKDAQEQIRIHRGKPLPGSLTHEKVRSPRAKRAATLGASMLAGLVATEQTGAAGAEQAGQSQAEQPPCNEA